MMEGDPAEGAGGGGQRSRGQEVEMLQECSRIIREHEANITPESAPRIMTMHHQRETRLLVQEECLTRALLAPAAFAQVLTYSRQEDSRPGQWTTGDGKCTLTIGKNGWDQLGWMLHFRHYKFPLWHAFTPDASPPLHTRSWLLLNGRGKTQHREVTILVCPSSISSQPSGVSPVVAHLSSVDGQSLVFRGMRWGAEHEARCKARIFTGRDVEYRAALARQQHELNSELRTWELHGEATKFRSGERARSTWHGVYRASSQHGTDDWALVQQAIEAENPKGELKAFARWVEWRQRINIGMGSLPSKPWPTVGHVDERCEVHLMWGGGGAGVLLLPGVDDGAGLRRPPRAPLLDLQTLCACRVQADAGIDEAMLATPMRVWAAARCAELGLPPKAAYREAVRRKEELGREIRDAGARDGEWGKVEEAAEVGGVQQTLKEHFRQVKPRVGGSNPATLSKPGGAGAGTTCGGIRSGSACNGSVDVALDE